VTLSWTPHKIAEQRLDVYEIFRERRRDRRALFLPTSTRIEALMTQGYTLNDILQATKECEKVKQGRSVTAAQHKVIPMIQV
jgi:hypothetical protein